MMIKLNCFTLVLIVSFSILKEDLYKDSDGMKEHMDFSGYDKSHPCYDNTVKKV